MCKYCERFNGDANNLMERQQIDLLEGRGINLEMFLTEDNDNPGTFRLQICNNLTNEIISSVKLDYCPFCRRKLNKALEDLSESELVKNAWDCVPPFEGEELSKTAAWNNVPYYTGFCGSTSNTDGVSATNQYDSGYSNLSYTACQPYTSTVDPSSGTCLAFTKLYE